MQFLIRLPTGTEIEMKMENADVAPEISTLTMQQWKDAALRRVREWLPTDEYKLELTGPRRIGKTTLTAQLPASFPEKVFLFIALDFSAMHNLREDCRKHSPDLVCWDFQFQHFEKKCLEAHTTQDVPPHWQSNAYFTSSRQLELLFLKDIPSIAWPDTPELVVVVEHWNMLPGSVLDSIITTFSKKLLIFELPLPSF